MLRVCGLNTCGHNVDQLRGSCKYGNAKPTAINFGDFLTRWGTVLPSHLTQHRTTSKSLTLFLSCGASTRFRAMVSPYEASRSLTLDTPHSAGFLWSSNQPDAETLPDNTQETIIHALAGFEPTIPASERQRSHAIDRAVTGIGSYLLKDK